MIQDIEGTAVLCLFPLAVLLCPTSASKGLPNTQVPSGTSVLTPTTLLGAISATDNNKSK